MAVTELKPFKLWVLQNFPFIEEDFDALTNYEMMCKIVEKLNEIVDVTNEQSKTFEYLEVAFRELKAYVDEHIEDVEHLEEEVALINERLDIIASRVDKNRNDISNLDIKIDSVDSTLRQLINNVENHLEDLINQNFNTLKNNVDYEDNILNEKIDNIQIGLINVYDPTTGLTEPLQTVINNLYELTNKDGITATEFDALELTCTQFENYQITAYEFDSSSKLILV